MNFLLGSVFSPHPPILIPEIGKGEEISAIQTISGLIEVADFVAEKKPQVIICITPHGHVFQDGACLLDVKSVQGDLSQFSVPSVVMEKKINQILNNSIKKAFDDANITYIPLSQETGKPFGISPQIDYGILVPLYYIDKKYQDYEIIHISIGGTSQWEQYVTGMKIFEAIENAKLKTLILASGDLSHKLKVDGPYGLNENGAIFDDILVNAIQNKKFENILEMSKDISVPAGECGLSPFTMALGAFDTLDVLPKVYSYEFPFGIGYMTGSLDVLSPKEGMTIQQAYLLKQREKYEKRKALEDIYISLARSSVELWIQERKLLDFDDFCKNRSELEAIKKLKEEQAGVFVSLHINGELRGCVGTIHPALKNKAEEIIKNAIQSATEDTRFSPVHKIELESLEIKVDILGAIEKITTENQLHPKKYGVVVESGTKKGLLLPNIEGIETVDLQVQIAKDKAGIKNNEEVVLSRFEVERHEVV